MDNKEFEKQKKEVLDKLWEKITTEKGWNYTEDVVPFNGAIKGAFLKQNYNPLHSDKNVNTIPYITTNDANGVLTITEIKNAIEKANKTQTTDITQWASEVQKNLAQQTEYIRWLDKNPLNRLNGAINDKQPNVDVINGAINFLNKENVEQMFKKEEPANTLTEKQKASIRGWLKAAGMEDKTDDFIKKYGDHSYVLAQNAMFPADFSEKVGGKYTTSKAVINDLLEGKIDQEKLNSLERVKATQKEEPFQFRPIDGKMADLEFNGTPPVIKDPSIMTNLDFYHGLGKDTADRLKLASCVRNTLEIEGMSTKRVQRACDKALKKCKDTEGDLSAWAVAYTSELINQLGLYNATNEDYINIAKHVEGIANNINENKDVGPIHSQYIEDITNPKLPISKRFTQTIKGWFAKSDNDRDEVEKGDVDEPMDMGDIVTFTAAEDSITATQDKLAARVDSRTALQDAKERVTGALVRDTEENSEQVEQKEPNVKTFSQTYANDGR